MTSFYEFINENKTPSSLALSNPEKAQTSTAATFNLVNTGLANFAKNCPAIPAKDAEKFGQDIAELVTNDSFLKELSKGIQTPMLGETENEFVSRCKRTLFGLIDKHLSKK
jgi:hypothetical protein